jgi:hypothetical protein
MDAWDPTGEKARAVKARYVDWGQIFEDTTVATAVLDRLLHHASVLSVTGDSYRMRRHRDAIAALRPALTSRPGGGEFP